MIRSKIVAGFFWALLALALCVWPMAPAAHAQGSRKDDIVFNSRGVPLAGATVRVCVMPASGQPCTPLAQIFSDAALTQALANPTTTDGMGNYFFYAAPGKYEIEFSGPSITTKQIPNVILSSDPTSPNFSSISSSGGISAFSLNLTGNLTVNGNTTVVGNLASGTLNLTNQSTAPGAAGTGTVNLYTKTTDKRLYYKDDTGTEIGPIANTTGAQTNVTNTFTAPQNFTAALNVTSAGTFTNTNTFNYDTLNINSLDINGEIVKGQGSGTMLTGLTGAVNVPNTSAVLNAVGVSGYAVNGGPSGQNAIGIYGQGRATANNTHTWGGNALAMDTAGLTTSVSLNGWETDVVPLNATSAYAAFTGNASILGSGSHAGIYGDGFAVATNVSTTQWGNGFRSAHGCCNAGYYVGKVAASGVSASQQIQLISNNGGSDLTSFINADAAGDIQATPVTGLLKAPAFTATDNIRGALVIADQGTACANGNIALSAGWGTTATVSAAAGTGQTCQFTLTSAGTGQATNATITDSLPNALPTANTVCTAQLTGGTGIAALSGAGLFINQTTLSATAPVFTFPGLPVAGSTYFVAIRCGP